MNFNKNWITHGLDEEAITFASEIGAELAKGDQNQGNGLTTSQIRNFFGEVKRIQARGYEKEKTAFLLIRPKLAYAEARAKKTNKSTKVMVFRRIMDAAHEQVKSPQHFQNFVDLLEAILAYHKANDGRD
jgi:CRISPR-associated protein Csm2